MYVVGRGHVYVPAGGVLLGRRVWAIVVKMTDDGMIVVHAIGLLAPNPTLHRQRSPIGVGDDGGMGFPGGLGR